LYVAGVQTPWKPPPRLAAKVEELRFLLGELDVDERHYAATTLYALAMGERRRRMLAAFFTPPFVVRHAIDSAVAAGLNLRRHTILDPAAGGAAFLSSLAGRMREAGSNGRGICDRLHGIEIDSGLAELARGLIAHRAGARSCLSTVTTGNALLRWKDIRDGQVHAVLANPPYGRVLGRTARQAHADHAGLVHPGHVNQYALFAGLATDAVRPGGVVVLVIPASFLTGPLFGALRHHLRTTCRIGSVALIAEANGAFLDVQQEACILTLKRRLKPEDARQDPVPFSRISAVAPQADLGMVRLPDGLDDPWFLPPFDQTGPADSLRTLADYGVQVRAGYFVWNREKARMTRRRTAKTVPLIWAANVRPGEACNPRARVGRGIDFVFFESDTPSIVREQAIVLQRTTNNRQARRLRPALVPREVLTQYGGFVTENHTIVVRALSPEVRLDVLCTLLSTDAVDQRFRRLSTGSHVSVKSLRRLELPPPNRFAALLEKFKDPEVAARFAYQMDESPQASASASDLARLPIH
jgi:adenine-specific DNA-methyltransferase